MASKALHQRFNLYADGHESYTFEPIPSTHARSLTFKRISGDIILNASGIRVVHSYQQATVVYGIMGTISLSTSDFIIVITGRELRGRLLGHDIFQATDFKVLPLDNSPLLDHTVENHLLALVHAHLASGPFFFSYTWDITRRLQAHWVANTEDQNKALWETADDRFFWNKFLQSRLIDISIANPEQDLSSFILPVMFGTFELQNVSINDKPFTFCLLSRRSRYRAGTRYFSRGIDENGHVSNFNESEQIVVYDEQDGPIPRPPSHGDQDKVQMSFVQIRGSIPLFWAEVTTLRYKPDLQIMNLPNSISVLRAHLRELIAIYGSQTLVSLVDQKGREKPMKEAFERAMAEANVPGARYQYFDFHNECKHMRWERISNLVDTLEAELLRKGYFHNELGKPAPLKLQLGTVRTNCMDNLDRTNVVQTYLAKWTLNRQLRAAGILRDALDTVDNHPAFLGVFRSMWADHADAIARAYGGSGAMKTDFTRTGKRTRRGLVDDGYKSVLRYLKNNYFDGAKQDAFDLMTGAWAPRGVLTANALVFDRRALIIRSMPYLFFFSLFMICAGLTLPRTSDYSLKYYFVFWMCLTGLSCAYIVAHGIDYVAWPKLNPPVDAIYYDGPGFRSAQHGKGFSIPMLRGARGAAGVRWLQQGQGRLKAALASHKLDEIEMGTKTRKRAD